MTENELLEELVRELYMEPLRDDEITAAMLADRLGVSREYAGRVLNAREKKGELQSRLVRQVGMGGSPLKAYSKVERF